MNNIFLIENTLNIEHTINKVPINTFQKIVIGIFVAVSLWLLFYEYIMKKKGKPVIHKNINDEKMEEVDKTVEDLDSEIDKLDL